MNNVRFKERQIELKISRIFVELSVEDEIVVYLK